MMGEHVFTHAVDSVLVRHNLFYVLGWALASDVTPERAEMQFFDQNDRYLGSVECRLWQSREDVACQFPAVRHARTAGFMIFGALPDAADVARTRVAFFRGAAEVYAFGLNLSASSHTSKGNLTRAMRHCPRVLPRVWRSLGWSRWLRTAVGLFRSSRARTARDAACGDSARARRWVWIVDHDMGGGANLYRQAQLDKLVRQGLTPVLLVFHVAKLEHFVVLPTVPDAPRWLLSNTSELEDWFEAFPPSDLIYNCLVSHPEPLVVLAAVLAAKLRYRASFTMLVHDFLLVCPSHTLLNADNIFCRVPDVVTCDACLSRHADGFVSVARERSITVWRQAWGRALRTADEVRFFSLDSRRWVLRAYPDMPTERWQVHPHSLHTALRTPRLLRGNGLHVGFVGHIGVHKGAQWVQALADAREKVPGQRVEISVLGAFDGLHPRDVTITGPYAPAQLPSMMEALGVNVVLFASICPETFSYVAHELVAMNVPTACFDLGAPSDLIRNYTRGCIIADDTPVDVLNQLIGFWGSTYPLQGENG